MATLSISEASDLLLKYLSSRGASSETIRAYTSDLRSLARDENLKTVSPETLDDVASSWLNRFRRTVSPKTTGRRVTSMKALGQALQVQVLLQYKTPTPAQAQPHPLPGGIRDLERMIELCDTDQQRALVALCGLVGARVSEARDATPKDFLFAERKLRIYGKGGRERIVPLSDRAWEILLPIVVNCILSPTESMIKMGDRSARDLITKIGVRAGVARRVSSHDLRATFATHAYRKTKDIRAVQMLLGHASSKQTEIYILVDDDSMIAAANFMEN